MAGRQRDDQLAMHPRQPARRYDQSPFRLARKSAEAALDVVWFVWVDRPCAEAAATVTLNYEGQERAGAPPESREQEAPPRRHLLPKTTGRLALLRSRVHPSITLVAAGASGFFTFIESGERPEQ